MKKFMFLITAVVIMVTAVACSVSSSKTVIFSIDNGDVIELKLDTSSGYDISTEVPFSVTSNKEEVASGAFADSSAYEEYSKAIDKEKSATKLEEGEKDGNKYLFWTVDGESHTEYNYIVKVGTSNTVVIIGSTETEEVARETFNRIVISQVIE